MKQEGCCAPRGRQECCGGETPRRLEIDFLYLDTETCVRCRETEENLEEAVDDVAALLKRAGWQVQVRFFHVQSAAQAEELHFLSSPTIRINGRDIALEVRENACGCCGDLAGEDIDCRVWLWQGREYEAPPRELLVDAMLRHVYGGAPSAEAVGTYALPDNLRRFFAGQAHRRGEAGVDK